MKKCNTNGLCIKIVELENEIEFMKENNISKGIRKKQYQLKTMIAELSRKTSQSDSKNHGYMLINL